MGWFGESTAHKQARYQKEANEQLQGYNLENMEVQQGYNLENMQRQFDYEQQNMANQFAYQKEAFNLENAYNTPSAQRMRMQAAGLNPNWSDTAAIGQMDAGVNPVAPSGGSPTGGASGSASPPGLAGTAEMKDIIGMLISKKQADLMQSEIDLNKTKQAKELSDARLNEVEIGERPKNYRSQRTSNTYGQWLNQSQTALNDALKDAQEINNKWIDSTSEATVNRLISEFDLNETQAHRLKELLNYEKRESAARVSNLLTQNWKMHVDASQEGQKIVLMGREVAVKEGTLRELHRHNVSVEKYQSFASYCLGNLHNMQAKGQEFKNNIWEIEGIVLAGAKKDGIPQAMAYEVLNEIRARIHNLEADTEYKKAAAEEKQNWFERELIGVFGSAAKILSNFGK